MTCKSSIVTLNTQTLIELAKLGKAKRLQSFVAPTPLATFLYIYNHASHEVYINYMEGARALAEFLAPIDVARIDITIPDILVSYDLQQIAIVLKPHTTIPLNAYQIENAIYEYLTQSR